MYPTLFRRFFATTNNHEIHARHKQEKMDLLEIVVEDRVAEFKRLVLEDADVMTREMPVCSCCPGSLLPPVFPACRYNAVKIVKFLLDQGVDPNSNCDGESWHAVADSTLLKYAVLGPRMTTIMAGIGEGPNDDTILLLLEHGADPNIPDFLGVTPLFEALQSPSTVRILLEHGADINQKDGHGITALEYAKRWGYRKTAELLSNWSS